MCWGSQGYHVMGVLAVTGVSCDRCVNVQGTGSCDG